MNSNPNPNVKLVVGVILAVATLATYIVLRVNKIETGELLLFATPLVTFLLVGGKVENESAKQNEVLNKIDKQTNGVLDERIRRETTKAVNEVLNNRADDPDIQQRLF